MPRIHVEFSELSLWRKIVCLCSLAFFFYCGTPAFYLENEIYSSAPAQPNSSTSQTIPVHVMHGFVRYITVEEAMRLSHWRSMADWVGLPAMIGFFTFAGPAFLAALKEERIRRATDGS